MMGSDWSSVAFVNDGTIHRGTRGALTRAYIEQRLRDMPRDGWAVVADTPDLVILVPTKRNDFLVVAYFKEVR